MIQVYLPGNTDYTHNGNVVVFPTICELQAELNGTWKIDLEAPIDKEKRWEYLVSEAVLKVPTWQDDPQLYRIANVEIADTTISAEAYPIFLDSAKDVFIMDKRPTNKTGQEALDILLDGTQYSGVSDLGLGTAYFVRRNMIDALKGTSPNFLERWGGEIEYNNFTINVKNRLGADHGVEIRYGKNIAGIVWTVDTDSIVTRIIPVAFNGRLHSNGYIDTTNNRPLVYAKEISYPNIKLAEDVAEGEDTTGLTVCSNQAELDAALEAAADHDFQTEADITIEADMATNDASLGSVRLGDSVYVNHTRLGISTKMRATKVCWDCILNIPSSISIGKLKKSYVQTVTEALNNG